MSKQISASLSVDSINRAIHKVEEYQTELNRKLIAAFEVLASEAADVVQESFGPSVKVESHMENSPIPNVYRYSITANGRAVGFLEFGAGTMADTKHPLAGNAPFEVRPGSYSEQNAHQFELLGFWIFGRHIYKFVVPRRGLYNGAEYVRQNVRDVVKRSIA